MPKISQASRMMKALTIQPIKVPKGYQHPPAPHEALPNHEFTMGLIAPKGAGKTTVICNLLNFYKGEFHTIIVFSPTVMSDEKWDVIKESKLLAENKPLKKVMREIKRKQKQRQHSVVPEPIDKPYDQELEPEFSPYIPEEYFFDDYDDDTFRTIMTEQLAMVRLLKRYGYPKYLANRVLIIFDDLVGSPLFKGAKGSYFTGVNTRHRHYSASFIMVSQGYKEIPKTIRTGFTCLIVFEIGNEKEIEVIYEEFSMGLNRLQWQELYEYCVATDFAFMYINFQKPKNMRIMKNFQEYLFFKKDQKDQNQKECTVLDKPRRV